MARSVRLRVQSNIAVVTFEAPPINALSTPVRAGLWDVFDRIETTPEIEAVVLMAAGRMFSAGADIREFAEDALKRPSLPQLCDRIEACSKPVVAAIHGQALGGGAELALAAHYRLGAPDTLIGLPEVALGLVPGAGGTQRLPRLVGADFALQMMLSAKPVDADVAQRIGLLDEVVQGDLATGAVTYARNLVVQRQGPRRSCDRRDHFLDGRAHWETIAKARAGIKGSPLHAPHRVVECVEAAAVLPFQAGLAFEADTFERCLEHPQSVALRHIFISERKTDKTLIERSGGSFKPVAPFGKAVEERLRGALLDAALFLVRDGTTEGDVDGAMVAYGFRRGPFGSSTAGTENETIVARINAALLAEGAAVLAEGSVQRPSDIDVLCVHGLGYPRRHGGPLRAAQSSGLIEMRNNMRAWAEMDSLWAVPPLLDQAIKVAGGFDSVAQV